MRWYVDDGCHTESNAKNASSAKNDYPGSYELYSFKAGVRCCSTTETGSSYTTTCTTIGKCPGDATYIEAFEMCREIGMDVCTKYELFTESCCGTGGDCDNHRVWTSTKESG